MPKPEAQHKTSLIQFNMSKVKEETKDFTIKTQGTGFLHKSVPNDKTKEGSPDYFGSMNLNGSMYDLAAWTKTGEKSGNIYLSLNVDIADMTTEEKEVHRKGLIKDFKADKKNQEKGKESFLLIEQTGTIHPQTDATKKDDFFGTLLLNGWKILPVKLPLITGFTYCP